MAAFAEPRREISGVSPYARELRREVETEDQDFHLSTKKRTRTPQAYLMDETASTSVFRPAVSRANTP
jgi:hypothetical protein